MMSRLWLHSIWILSAMFTALLIMLSLVAERYALRSVDPLPFLLGFSLGFMLLQFWLSPKLIDWLVGFKKGNPDEMGPEFGDWLERTCRDIGIPRPRFAVIEEGGPNAFTYGHGPWNARVAVTRGLRDSLGEDEVRAVVAHELGHIRHYDFILMTLVQAMVLLFYYCYRFLLRSGGGGEKRFVVAIAAGLIYYASELVALYFSRVREYMADRFAAKVTRNPAGLATALVKISYGLALVKAEEREYARKSEKDKEGTPAPSYRASHVRALGIAPLGIGSISALVNQDGVLDPSKYAMAARWEVTNLWAKYINLLSTHPLTTQRVEALRQSAHEIGQDFPLERPVAGETNWPRFLVDVLAVTLPLTLPILVGFGVFAGTANLAQSGWLAAAAFMVGFILKLLFSYPLWNPKRAPIQSLLEDTDTSHVYAKRVELRGKIVSRATPLFFAHDFVLQDESGIVPCHVKTFLGIRSAVFGLFEAERYIGEDVVLRGWYRRFGAPFVEIESFAVEHKGVSESFDYRIGWYWILGMLGFFCLAVGLTAF